MTQDELAAANAEVFKHFDRQKPASEWKRQLFDWAFSVLYWDGLLPIVVIAIPGLVVLLLPNWQLVQALFCIFCPVIAFGVRFVIGWVRMRARKSYAWQMLLFTIGISSLFLFEAFILNDFAAKGPKIAQEDVLLPMFLIYLAMMAIALFPLRSLLNRRNRVN